MAKHNDLGDKGEEIAGRYLVQKGYRITERNFRYGRGEIDIIAKKDGLIVFVEVKTRSNSRYGSPAEAITTHKQEVLKRTATYYLINNTNEECNARFDVIEVIFNMYGKYKISHIQDAF